MSSIMQTTREVKNYTVIKLPVIQFCPITGNQPMRCLRAGFEASCKKFQLLEENRYEKISIRSDHLTKYCALCRGECIPDNVTFIDPPTTTTKNKGEKMPASKYTPGKCDSCGGEKRVTAHLGKNICSSCMSFRCGCKNAPELVLAALKEFGNLPAPEVQAAINSDSHEETSDLKRRALNAETEAVELKREIAELNKVQEVLKAEIRINSHSAPGLDIEKKTAIHFLAWKLADGLLTGDITGIGVSDIRTIRGLAE